MWILAIIAWKRPRLAANLVLAWLGIMAFCVTVAAPGRLFLRAAGEPVPYSGPVALDMAGFVLGPLVLLAVVVYLLERPKQA